MGYTTDFSGYVDVEPPLNEHEISFLRDFSETRRMHRGKGPLFVKGSGMLGQGPDDDVLNHNASDPDQPGLWCQWVPNDEGATIEWDGGEKFYNSAEWMKYIVENLLAPSSRAYLARHLDEDERLRHFTSDHVVNGTIDASGEDPSDVWQLIVEDNVVSVANGEITFSNRTVL